MNGHEEASQLIAQQATETTVESEALLGLVNYWQGLLPHQRVLQRDRLKRDAIACSPEVYELALATADDESERRTLEQMRADGLVLVGMRAVRKAHTALARRARKRR